MLVYSGSNTFWILLNSEPVIKTIKTLSKRSKGTTLAMFDFLNLYTKITKVPHNKFLKIM